MAAVSVVLVDEADAEVAKIETTFEVVGEAGVIEYGGEFFTFRSTRGQFYSIPVFQRVKKVEL